MNTAYVALGANIGDPAATVLAAFAALANLSDSTIEKLDAVADSGQSAYVGSEIAKNDRPELTAAKIIVSPRSPVLMFSRESRT